MDFMAFYFLTIFMAIYAGHINCIWDSILPTPNP